MDLFSKVGKITRAKEVVPEEVVVPWNQSTFVNSVGDDGFAHLLDIGDGELAKGL